MEIDFLLIENNQEHTSRHRMLTAMPGISTPTPLSRDEQLQTDQKARQKPKGEVRRPLDRR